MEAKLHTALPPSHAAAPTPFDFLDLYLKHAKLGKLAACRAHYYCERVVQVGRQAPTNRPIRRTDGS